MVVLYSGGLDSSLLAWCLRTRQPVLFTIGTEGSHDQIAGRTGATILGLPHAEFMVTPIDVAAALDQWAVELELLEEPLRSVVVTEALAMEHAPPGLLILGQGADELFHGYAHFRGLAPTEAVARSGADLTALEKVEWPRAQRIASQLGRRASAPFLDPDFVRLVRAFPGSQGVDREGLAKPLLRRMAEELGLPAPLVRRPKKAMQYGSGVARLVRASTR